MAESKDERIIDDALGYAVEYLRNKYDRLDAVIDEFDLPEPNDISNELDNVRFEIDRVSALKSRRYHAKVAKLTESKG